MKEVVGIEKVDYVSKKTQKQVVGVKLHLIFETENVNGFACESVYVPERVDCIGDVKVGDKVKIYYDRYGSVEDLLISRADS